MRLLLTKKSRAWGSLRAAIPSEFNLIMQPEAGSSAARSRPGPAPAPRLLAQCLGQAARCDRCCTRPVGVHREGSSSVVYSSEREVTRRRAARSAAGEPPSRWLLTRSMHAHTLACCHTHTYSSHTSVLSGDMTGRATACHILPPQHRFGPPNLHTHPFSTRSPMRCCYCASHAVPMGTERAALTLPPARRPPRSAPRLPRGASAEHTCFQAARPSCLATPCPRRRSTILLQYIHPRGTAVVALR